MVATAEMAVINKLRTEGAQKEQVKKKGDIATLNHTDKQLPTLIYLYNLKYLSNVINKKMFYENVRQAVKVKKRYCVKHTI